MGSWKDFRKGKDMQRAVLPVYGVRGRDRADERRNVVIGAALDEEREKLPVVENGRPVKRRAPKASCWLMSNPFFSSSTTISMPYIGREKRRGASIWQA